MVGRSVERAAWRNAAKGDAEAAGAGAEGTSSASRNRPDSGAGTVETVLAGRTYSPTDDLRINLM